MRPLLPICLFAIAIMALIIAVTAETFSNNRSFSEPAAKLSSTELSKLNQQTAIKQQQLNNQPWYYVR